MTITAPGAASQTATEFYKELLNIVRREAHNQRPPSPRQNWRFQAPEPNPQLSAYWAELFKEEHAALAKDWAEPRIVTPITTDTLSEAEHVSIQQAAG